MIVSESIPKEKMNEFHNILCSTGGRYLSNPLILQNRVLVHCEPGGSSGNEWGMDKSKYRN